MISHEILKKVRRIAILSRKSSREILAGEYHSAFKGRGMEFSEVREYQTGDDIRFIDWNVSSRTGRLHVKQFIEERELTVLLAIDLSASLRFFSRSKSKQEIAAELAALIAFTAMLNNDKVGLLLFTEDIERYIPPQKGRTHHLRIIREILTFKPRSRGTSLKKGLEYLNRVIKKRAIVFLISDFLDRNFEKPLKLTGRKHDLVAVNISDPREQTPPKNGLFLFRDLESDREFYTDFSSTKIRSEFLQQQKIAAEFRERLFLKAKVDEIKIGSDRNCEKPLFAFFMKRKRRFYR